jgi:hypothetical protein
MTPTTDIKHTAQRGQRWLLNGMLPLAACMAIVTAAPTARAELANQSVACAGAQQTEGEGGTASTFGQQQKTEGEGGSASTFTQLQKTVAIPCKG